MQRFYPGILGEPAHDVVQGGLLDVTHPAEETLYPEGLESVPPRYAISHRNRWMLAHAEYVITYVAAPVGGAAKAVETALRKNKKIINLHASHL